MFFPVEHFSSGEYLYNRIIEPVRKKYDLTHMEFTVLIFLANNPQYDTAAQILRVRKLTKSHVSVSLRSLQERGLVTGEYRDRNRRTVHLNLTEAAAPIVADGRKAQDAFFSLLFEGFTEQEKEQLDLFLRRIDGNIKNGIQEMGVTDHE